MNIREFKQQFPQYSEVDDGELSRALHRKYYSHVPFEEFDAKFREGARGHGGTWDRKVPAVSSHMAFGTPIPMSTEPIERAASAANKGLVSSSLNVASGMHGTLSFLSKAGGNMPGKWYPDTPEIATASEQFEQRHEAAADIYQAASRLPRFQLPEDASLIERGVNVVFQVPAYAMGAVASSVIGGPAGAWAFTAGVEGDNAYRDAREWMRENRPDLSPEQIERRANAERLIVGPISGLLEMMQVKGIMKLTKGEPKSLLAKTARKVGQRIMRNKLAQKEGVQWTAETLADFATEGVQEALQQLSQEGAADIVHGEPIDWEAVRDSFAAGIVGYGGIAGAGRVIGAIGQAAGPDLTQTDWTEFEGTENPEELTNWYEPTPRVMPKADAEDAVSDTAVYQDVTDRPKPKVEDVTPEEQSALDRLEAEEVQPEVMKVPVIRAAGKRKLGRIKQRGGVWYEYRAADQTQSKYRNEDTFEEDEKDQQIGGPDIIVDEIELNNPTTIELDKSEQSKESLYPIRAARELGVDISEDEYSDLQGGEGGYSTVEKKLSEWLHERGSDGIVFVDEHGTPLQVFHTAPYWSDEGGKGTVAPNLYIGNTTARAKKVWADQFNQARQAEGIPGRVEPADVEGPTEGGFPTKRAPIEITRAEAEETLAQLEEAMDEQLEQGEWSSMEIALMKAMWGDIRELRTVLGHDAGRMPFRVQYRGNKPVVEIASPVERTYAAIKGPSKKVMAQWTPKELVTQGEALAAKLKAVAREAARAYRQGAKEAVAKLRRDLRIIHNRQRIIKAIRDYRRRLVERITRPVGEGVDPLYARAIRTMADAMDTQGRSADTKKRLAGLERALKADPGISEAILSSEKTSAKHARNLDLLKRLAQVPVENMSTEQLQQLANERIRLERQGRLQNRQLAHKRQAQAIRDDLTRQLKTRKPRPEMGARERRQAGRFKKLLEATKRGAMHYGLGQYRMDRFMEWLDNFARGPFTKYVWEPMKRLSTESSIRRNQKLAAYYDFLRSKGIDPALWMGAKQTITLQDGSTMPLSKFELIGIYVFGQDAGSRSHLTETRRERELRQAMESGEITEEQFYAQWAERGSIVAGSMTAEELKNLKERYATEQQLRRNLGLTNEDVDMISAQVEADPDMKAVADYMTETLNDRWAMIQQVAREVGIDPTELVKVGKYLPMLIRDVDYTKQDDLLQRVLGKFIPEDFLAEKKFLETRKAGAQQDLELDAQLLFMHSISEVEHFLTMTPMLSKLSHVLANKDFRSSLDRLTRGYGSDIMAQWVVDTARGRVVREQGWVAKRLHKLNRHGIIYALGYNLPVIFRQSISGLNALASDPRMIPHLIHSIVFNSSPWSFDRLQKDVFEKSAVVRERDMEHLIADQWNQKHLRKMVFKQFGHRFKGAELSKMATAGIRKVDMWTVTHAWKSAYDFAIEDGASEEAAIRYADRVIQRTQPMARPEDLPHFFRGGIIEQLFAMFQNQVNQNINFWTHDIYGARKHGKITNTEVMYRVVMSYALPALVFGMLSRGGTPPDPKQAAMDLLLYAGGAPLFFGRVLNNAITGWSNSLGLWGDILDAPGDIAKGIAKGDRRSVFKGAGKLTGALLLPGSVTGQTVRSAEGAHDLLTGTTADPRRLIWSEWALSQGESEDGGDETSRRSRKRRSRRRRSRRK